MDYTELHNSDRRRLRRLSLIFVFDVDGDLEMTDIDASIACMKKLVTCCPDRFSYNTTRNSEMNSP